MRRPPAQQRHLASHGEPLRQAPSSSSTPVAKVIRDRGIRVPDEQSDVPLLEQLQAELAKSDVDGAFAGITYDLTRGNSLPRDWIVQTPDDWGARRATAIYPFDCKAAIRVRCHPAQRCRLQAVLRASASLQPRSASARSAGIRCVAGSPRPLPRSAASTSLLPPPDTASWALRKRWRRWPSSGRPVTVRILIGHYPSPKVDAATFLKALTSGLEGIPKARLSVSVAAMRSCVVFEDCDSYSWNHAKIVSVDGVDALVGGHNMWSADYLIDDPVQ